MKRFLALTILALVLQPAQAGIFDMMIYGPPDRYGQAFAQCAASTITAAQELECARQSVLRDPVPAVGLAEMTAFFERGRALVEAVRRGRISDAEARTEMAENVAAAQSRVQATVQQRIRRRHHQVWCNPVGDSTFCNGY
jgi:hypothetical protein